MIPPGDALTEHINAVLCERAERLDEQCAEAIWLQDPDRLDRLRLIVVDDFWHPVPDAVASATDAMLEWEVQQ